MKMISYYYSVWSQNTPCMCVFVHAWTSFLRHITEMQFLVRFILVLCCSSSVDSGRQHINGVDVYYEKTGRGGHPVLLLPGALGKHSGGLISHASSNLLISY